MDMCKNTIKNRQDAIKNMEKHAQKLKKVLDRDRGLW
jgi:hypothetical protein